jgi:hypothetical protein
MRNLLGRLHERSPASLAGIARCWSVDLRGRDIHQDVGHLFRVMTDPWAFAMTYERLEPSQRRLLCHVIEHGQAAAGHEIAASLDREFDDVREDLQALYRAGFLFAEHAEGGVDDRGEDRLLVAREIGGLVRRIQEEQKQKDPDECTLTELLDHLDDAELSDIAEGLGYTVIPAVALRADLIEYLRPRLSDPERIARIRGKLTGATAALYQWLETVGRSYPESARSSLELTQGELRAAIHKLVSHGLIWRGYDESGKLEIVLPSQIREPAPIPAAPAPELVTIPVEQVEESEWTHPFACAWDLLIALRETQVGRTQALARMLRDGGHQLSASASRRLAAMLWNANDETVPTGYLWFLAALADSEQLLDEADPPGLTDAVRPWTRLSFAEQQQRLVSHWLRWTNWYEARGRDSIEVWGARWPEFRERLVEQLTRLEPDTWYTVASFAEHFSARNPDALGTQFSAALNREQIDQSMEARRRDVVRFAAELTMLSACTWLRLIEISRSRRRGYVFRVTGVGCWSLGLEENVPEEPAVGEHPIAVQPTFDVLLLQPEPRMVWALSGFADLIELDRISTFRLTEASIHRALDAGASVEQILRALHRYGGGDLPENVAYQVQDWESRYRRARLSVGMVIELSHSGEMARLEEALELQGLTLERLASDRLMIRVESLDRVESASRAVQATLRDLEITARWR